MLCDVFFYFQPATVDSHLTPPLVAQFQAHQSAPEVAAEDLQLAAEAAYIDDTHSPAIRCMSGSTISHTARIAICFLWQACARSDSGTGTSDVPWFSVPF